MSEICFLNVFIVRGRNLWLLFKTKKVAEGLGKLFQVLGRSSARVVKKFAKNVMKKPGTSSGNGAIIITAAVKDNNSSFF